MRDYKHTIQLPKSSFGMRANLTQKEPQYLQKWQDMQLYQKREQARQHAPLYFLHDGPPYANGAIHIGHALNKILKDLVGRYAFMLGFRAPYVPGWDCHGLPIEQQVMEQLGDKAKELSRQSIRKQCRAYADKQIARQRTDFKRLGILGNWDDPYKTMDAHYELAIIQAFRELVAQGLIYRQLRPVAWSPASETALADAEIEYYEHESPSLYLKFPVVGEDFDAPCFILVWTTTPWTLPANSGLAFHPHEAYVVVEHHAERWICARARLGHLEEVLGVSLKEPMPLSSQEIQALHVRHPWIDRASRVVFGEHVTMDVGTGIVHTAPGHGMDDYLLGIREGLELRSPVDDQGCFTAEVPQWEGELVFTANPKIVQFLEQRGLVVHAGVIRHSYPHDWRTKTPLIFRAKPQWFLEVSNAALQKKTLSQLSQVQWVPPWGEERLRNMLDKRPDWCISRQRNWGVPIPAFYCTACGQSMLETAWIDHVIAVLAQEGVDNWYELQIERLLPPGAQCSACHGTSFRREEDIFDVWFDSGTSHYAVLAQRSELSHKALDETSHVVYLEGSDQYRGWFQSSLWLSMGIYGELPFHEVITHGWVLDEFGHAMHKSLGNTVSPMDVVHDLGADVLRVWILSEDTTKDLRIGETLIQRASALYRSIRNTFRYLLGNLYDFDVSQRLPYEDMLPLDKMILSKLYRVSGEARKAVQTAAYHRSFRLLTKFCITDLSAEYLDILKDRLYVYPSSSRERRSAQSALSALLEGLILPFAPIVPFTMEEVFETARASMAWSEASVHLMAWQEPPLIWYDATLDQDFEQLFQVRDQVLQALQRSRDAGHIKSNLDAWVSIQPATVKAPAWELLKRYGEAFLRDFFIVSHVVLQVSSGVSADADSRDQELDIQVTYPDTYRKCVRCWHTEESVGQHATHPDLCERCVQIIEEHYT